jgi:hypothetical protein
MMSNLSGGFLMILFKIEYEVLSSGMTFTCDVVGINENDVVQDISSQVGQIRVLSIYHKSSVHRITGTIRKNIIENYLVKSTSRGKGRPRKLDL